MIRCLKCGLENPEDVNFCNRCAVPLTLRCSECGRDSSLAARFCGQCGAVLRDAVSESAAASAEGLPAHLVPTIEAHKGGSQPTPRGERRHLTVLFSDLVDSTRMASSLDPEEWREIVDRYRRATAQAAERFGGHVAKYLGDGVMIYFGYPEAHENDAERAVHAGLAIVNAVAALNEQLTAEKRPLLAVRIGIDTGSVVIGNSAGRDGEIFGDTPNIAARLQALAQRDTVIITATVHRLVSGLFMVEDCGTHMLKGISQPMQLYRVLRQSAMRDRMHAVAAARGLTPFVGREDELRILQSRWERAQEGEGQLVMLVGEPGIGKSRVVHQFHDAISATPHGWIECGGTPFLESAPFHPVSEMLRQTFAWQGAESPDEKVRDLERALESAGLKLSEAVPLVAPLVHLDLGDRYPQSPFFPEERRRRLIATLATWVFGLAKTQPLVIVVEDLLWVDPSTLELQALLAEQGATAPLLLLYTARPEFRAPWPMRAHHLQIALNRLSQKQVIEMVKRAAAGAHLATDVVDAVAKRTGGVPLFVEELTRLVVETGSDASSGAIPATLHDSLMARLDRLGSAKEMMQVGAVIGREFSYELIRAVLPATNAELQEGLRKAVDAELLYVRGFPPDATYLFKHALVQEAAYQALLRTRRKELHRTVAKVLTEHFPNLAAAHPELLAHHHTEAQEAEQALSAWQRAGEVAVSHGALKEAEDRYSKAIAVIDAMSDEAGLEHRRLFLQLALGQVLIATKGYAATEVQQAYNRARELGKRVGDPAQLVFVLMGVWVSHLIRSELHAAQAVADQTLAAVAADSPLRIWGHMASGITRYHLGELSAAWMHLERAGSLYKEEADNVSPQDPGVAALGYASRAALQLGMPDTARERIRHALALAERLQRPFDLASAYSYAAGLHLSLGESRQAREYAQALSRIATEKHMPFYQGDSAILLGGATAEEDSPERGIEMMREGVAHQIANGQRVGLGFYLAFLGEAQLRAGAFEAGLSSVEEGLAAVPNERVDHPHLLQLRGEIQLKLATNHLGQSRQDHLRLAERSLRDAIGVSREVGSRAYELRAGTLLARALKSMGRVAEARDILTPVYKSFSQGFDTMALKEAKALLDELN